MNSNMLSYKLKEMNHDNLLTFMGASIEPGSVFYVTSYCSRGTVQVIFNCAAAYITDELK